MSFRPVSRFLIRHPVLVILSILALTVGLGSGMVRLRVDTDLTDDIPSTIPEKVFYDQVGENLSCR